MTPQPVGLHVDHIAIWTSDIERSKLFYQRYFGAQAGDLYRSQRRSMQSYFLTFQAGARLEIMTLPDLGGRQGEECVGLSHFALRVGSRKAVDQFVETLRCDHVAIAGEPRVTGDGYYEAVILDPDGNSIELVA